MLSEFFQRVPVNRRRIGYGVGVAVAVAGGVVHFHLAQGFKINGPKHTY
jgi:hypothetical protein